MIKINLLKDYNLSGYRLLEGFPSVGLVGPMVNSYIIEKLNMEYIGYIESDSFPPISAIHGATPLFPVRIYKDDKYKIITLISEFTIPVETVYQMSYEIIDFCRKHGIEEIISIGGIAAEKSSNTVFAISSDKSLLERATKAGISPIEEGVVAGVSAILLSNAAQYGLHAIDLLVPVNPAEMDPKNAEIVILNLKKLINIEIDIKDLEREAKIIEAKTRSILKKTKESHDTYSKAIDATGPSAYV